jgi:hypothetical protein
MSGVGNHGKPADDGHRERDADAGDGRSVRRRMGPSPAAAAASLMTAAQEDLGAERKPGGLSGDEHAERRVKRRICTTKGSVLASSVEHIYVGTACEGPGDPSHSCATETATWPTSAADVADTVAGGDVAAALLHGTSARVTHGARGKAASGPPPRFGCAVGGHNGHDWHADGAC